jgi:hypothetical protein
MSDRPEYQHSSSAIFLSGSTSNVTCLTTSSLTRDGVFLKILNFHLGNAFEEYKTLATPTD